MSATVWSISTKFGTVTRIGPLVGARWRHLADTIERSACLAMQPYAQLLWPLVAA